MIRLTVAGIVGTIAFAILAASVVLQGPRLGKLIEGALPPNAGKLMIGGVEWHLRALVDIAGFSDAVKLPGARGFVRKCSPSCRSPAPSE